MDYRAYGAPVEEGKMYEVDIKELSRRGDGLAATAMKWEAHDFSRGRTSL